MKETEDVEVEIFTADVSKSEGIIAQYRLVEPSSECSRRWRKTKKPPTRIWMA